MSNKTELTRRSFLTGAGVIAASVGAASLAGCAPQAQESLSETGGNADGATAAVADGTPTWLGAEPEVDESALVETVDCDVLVVGAGTAGCFAVCSAAEEGAKTVLIEKYAEGASSGIRDDIGAVGTKIQAEVNSTLDVELLARCFQHTSGFRQNQRVANVWFNESGETYDWYADRVEEAGFKANIRQAKPSDDDQYTPYGIPSFDTCHYVQWKEGVTPLENVGPSNNRGCETLINYARGLGADCRFETTMTKLIKEGDRVVGAYAEATDGPIRINAAKGVILCTGGYSMNPDMMSALQPEIVRVAPAIKESMPGATGDGIKAGLWAGGVLDLAHACSCAPEQIIPEGVAYEDIDPMALGFSMCGMLPFLRVNTEGKRFCNEDDLFDSTSHELAYQKDPYFITLYDSNWADYAQKFNVYHAYRFTPYDNGALQLFGDTEFVQASIDEMVESGTVIKADTLDELAERLDIPADTFKAEVARYNELVAAGKDTDFYKPAFRLTPFDTPPFYAERNLQDVYHTMDGLIIDEDMRVLDEVNEPIEGLYAAGDVSSCFLGATYLGVAAGIASGRSITFGRHAGRVAAQS
ncbi:FAD-binding protein [Adlercreutzia sp. R25]|uniref:FAD-dependent oxidoreductase n=1 Tax=Adlercreutzia shanghongiae TaxID=3111773 RepID=UPI002DBE4BD8|nr:FAD-binding protein [Adlercreutzia sp. R25]MEC4271865.1 FAD-binding protein [Adlercreutzia sp. R25]